MFESKKGVWRKGDVETSVKEGDQRDEVGVKGEGKAVC